MRLSDFLDSAWCNCGLNCYECRDSTGEIHHNIMDKYPDLVCPLGIPENPKNLPEKAIKSRYLKWRKTHRNKSTTKKPYRHDRVPCKYASIGDCLAFPNMPCKGRVITCLRDKSCVIVYESICNKDKCNFYEPKE